MLVRGYFLPRFVSLLSCILFQTISIPGYNRKECLCVISHFVPMKRH